MKSFLQQRFVSGEVGERLNGLVNTQAYAEAVRMAENVTITPIGSMRAIPKYAQKVFTEITEPLIATRRLQFGVSALISDTKIYIYHHATNTIKSSAVHEVANPTIYNIFENYVVIGNLSTLKIMAVNRETGTLGNVDFFSQIKKPVRSRLDLKVGIYRWIIIKEFNYLTNQYEDKKQLIKIGNYDDLESVGTDGSGNLIVTGIKAVKRMYFIASSTLTREVFNDADFSDGDTILNFEQGQITDFYINSKNVTFSGVTTDGKGNYWTSRVSVNKIGRAHV